MAYPYSIPSGHSPRPDISATSKDFNQKSEENKFIGHLICPDCYVPDEFGTYPRIDEKEFFDEVNVSSRLEPGASAPDSEMNFATGTYQVRQHGQQTHWDLAIAERMAHWWDVPTEVQTRLDFLIARQVERNRCNFAFNSDNVNTTSTPNVLWTSTATATPVNDIETMKNSIFEKCGHVPDTLVISQETLALIRQCDQVKDYRIGEGAGTTAEPNNLTVPWLASLFGLDRVLVSTAPKYDTSASKWSYMYPNTQALLLCSYAGADLTFPGQWIRRLWTDKNVIGGKKAGKNAIAKADYDEWDDENRRFRYLRGMWWEENVVINKNAAGILTIRS